MNRKAPVAPAKNISASRKPTNTAPLAASEVVTDDEDAPHHVPAAGSPVCRSIEYARAMCKSTETMVRSVTLVPSQFPGCMGINMILEPALKARMVSPLIMVEGEVKIYKSKMDAYNRGGGTSFFIKVRPKFASPMLYQLIENVYRCVAAMSRGPAALSPPVDIDTVEENTFKDGHIYINKYNLGLLEYTGGPDERSVTIPIADEIENLSKKESQIARVILTPVTFYRTSGACKVTFAIKKMSMERVCKTVVVGPSGDLIEVVMTEDEESGRRLGLLDEDDELAQEQPQPTLFSV
ncbi:ssDNA-binding phosphoprotein [Western grey kangaroopox virus]|uniref:Protein OPG079 n=1 Tax=Western grey kangaroopox virus TaxID=1566307 RepID=A0A2C9DSK6_9POXV|nr:ssDNA-binding phosphoprotein [Western grey kangaroopox virus]ATI20989.1 ssDNA-binding phosphoprotein [Western grey kangaroopox virus]